MKSRIVLRRIGAVLAGLVAIFAVTTAVDVVLHAAGIFPPWGQPMSSRLFGVALAYRIAFGVMGGYIAARLAPDFPMRHAIALGVIGVVISLAATIATWNRGPEFGPKWYPIALVVISIPCAWAGGKQLQKEKNNGL